MNKQTALVTGAGRGIGRGIAVALAEKGWNVVVNYRGNAAAATETVRLVEEAGGRITKTDMQTLRYNTKDDLLNPHFLVIGDPHFDWAQYL